MARKGRGGSNYLSNKKYIQDLEEASDTRSPVVKKQESEVDQVFEDDVQPEEEDDGGSNFLRDFWDSLTN